MIDKYNRKIDYLRISVTDRCNLRCSYCMPSAGVQFRTMEEILTYEEIILVCRAAALSGIRKIKITGGEPLVRKGIAQLIGKIAKIPGITEVTMTTNGIYLKELLPELLKNHLSAVNISLDTLDPVLYKNITGVDALAKVFQSIQACVAAGLKTKVNAVLSESLFEEKNVISESSWEISAKKQAKERLLNNCLDLLELSRNSSVDVRFIEMMPIGLGRAYTMTSGDDVLRRIRKEYPGIRADYREHGNGPAVYYTIPGFKGSLGFISAMHGKFCDQCNRIRMTSTGQIKPCLCYSDSYDLRAVLRNPDLDETFKLIKMKEIIIKSALAKPREHCFEHPEEISEMKKMAMIGG